VKHREFKVGDLVLRKVTLATKDPTQGKLGPTWEGPYRVVKFHRKGTYNLEKLDGTALPHPWNAEHLKKYYQQGIIRMYFLLLVAQTIRNFPCICFFE
jgi:hypothetical protein